MVCCFLSFSSWIALENCCFSNRFNNWSWFLCSREIIKKSDRFRIKLNKLKFTFSRVDLKKKRWRSERRKLFASRVLMVSWPLLSFHMNTKVKEKVIFFLIRFFFAFLYLIAYGEGLNCVNLFVIKQIYRDCQWKSSLNWT